MRFMILFITLAFAAAAAVAQQAIEQVIPITTASEAARTSFLQGRDQLENIDFQAAARLFDQAIEKDPHFALAHLYRSQSGGSALEVRAHLQKAAELAARASEGERLLIAFYQASYDANGRQIRENLDRLLLLYPDDKRVKTSAGYYYQGIGEYDQAIDLYNQALQIDRNYAPPNNFLGYSYMAIDDFAAAEKAFREYIRLMPHLPNPYDSYAEFLLKQGRYDESILQYQKAYETDNQFLNSLAGIGNNYIFKGEFEQARRSYQQYYNESVRIDDKLTALRLSARSFLYEDKIDQAIAVYARHRLLAEQEKQYVLMINTALREGFILAEFGRPADGLNQCKKTAEMIDRLELGEREKENLHLAANYWLAHTYAANQMLTQAKTCCDEYRLEVLRRQNPDELAALEAVQGYIAFQGKEYDTALAFFKKAANDPWSTYYAAQCLLKKGEQKAANQLLEKLAGWNQQSIGLASVWRRTQRALRE